MKKRHLMALSLGLTLILAACGGESGSSEGSSSQSSYSEPTFAASDYQGLLGAYHAKEGEMTLTAECLMYGDLLLAPTEIKGEGLETEIVYGASLNAGFNYTLSLEEKGEGFYGLLLKKDEEEIASFMPSLAGYDAFYAGNDADDYYNFYYSIGDYYDERHDLFKIGVLSYSGASDTTYYALSGYGLVDGALRLTLGMYDYADDYLYDLYYPGVDESKGPTLYGYDASSDEFYESWQSVVGALSFTFVGDGWADWNGYYDPESKTLTMADYATEYSVSNGFDGEGQLISLSNDDTVSTYLRPNPTGLDAYDAEGKALGSYAYNDFYYSWYGIDYVRDGVSVSFGNDYDDDWNLVYAMSVDGEAVEAEFIVENAKMAAKTLINGEETVFSVDKSGISLRAEKGEGTAFYLNYAAYSDRYAGSFYAVKDGVVSTLSISSSFGVTCGGKECVGSLSYEEGDLEPHVVFILDEVEYTFTSVDESIGYYSLVAGEAAFDYFSESVYSSLNDTFTSTGVNRLYIDDGKLGFGESADTAYDLEAYTENDGIDYLISLTYQTGTESNRLLSSNGIDIYTTTGVTGSYNIGASYIPLDGFEALVGEYRACGRYGTETIKLSSDGHFYADTINDEGTGLTMSVEYSFSLAASLSDGEPVYGLSFLTDGVSVPAYLSEGNLVIGTATYYPSYIYDLSVTDSGIGAVYQNGSDLIYVENGSFYYNGELVEVENGHDSPLEVTIDGESVSLTIGDDGLTLAFSSGSRTFAKQDFDIDSYLGDYTVDVSGTSCTYSFKKTTSSSNLLTGYGVEVQAGVVYKASVVLRDGVITIKASVTGVDIYIYNNGTENVMEYVSSIPLPPSL